MLILKMPLDIMLDYASLLYIYLIYFFPILWSYKANTELSKTIFFFLSAEVYSMCIIWYFLVEYIIYPLILRPVSWHTFLDIVNLGMFWSYYNVIRLNSSTNIEVDTIFHLNTSTKISNIWFLHLRSLGKRS